MSISGRTLKKPTLNLSKCLEKRHLLKLKELKIQANPAHKEKSGQSLRRVCAALALQIFSILYLREIHFFAGISKISIKNSQQALKFKAKFKKFPLNSAKSQTKMQKLSKIHALLNFKPFNALIFLSTFENL